MIARETIGIVLELKSCAEQIGQKSDRVKVYSLIREGLAITIASWESQWLWL